MKMYILWLLSILKFLLGRRFLLISPPLFKKQLWYDRKSKKYFTIRNRNATDWYTNHQVFLDDQFSLSFMENPYVAESRNKDVNNKYNEIINSGRRPLIIDCGGNNGASCIYFHMTYPEAQIVCLEIGEENFSQLIENTNLQNIKLIALNEGIASEDSFGDFIDPGIGNNAYRIQRCAGQGSIKLVSINSVLKNINLQDSLTPFLIKIDIEGGEEDLFSENTGWVKDFPVLIVELHDWLLPKKKTSLNFLNVISRENRDYLHRGENIFSISNDI